MAKSILLPCFNPYMYTLILYVASIGYVKSDPTIKYRQFQQLMSLHVVQLEFKTFGNPSIERRRYSCDNNGVVDKIAVTDGNITNVRVLNKNGTLCDKGAGNDAAVIQCIQEFKSNTSKNDTVKVTSITLLYEQEQSNEIIGGQNSSYFTLTCNIKSATKTAIGVFFSVNGTITPQKIPAELKEQPVLHISKQSSIHIGDPLTLTMTVGGNYILKPLFCNAGRTAGDPKPIKIWEDCNIVDLAIVSANVWTEEIKPSSLSLVMYAFKFTNSPTVHITCTTMVCPSTDLTPCKTVCPTTTAAPAPKTSSTTSASKTSPSTLAGRRRRRSAMDHDESDSKSSTKSATVSFEIDSAYQSNNSDGVCSSWYQYIFAIIMAYWFVKRS